MLFNPKWNVQNKTKLKPWTKAHVLAWLRTKPADGTYCYTDNGACLIAQYLTYLGYHRPYVSGGGEYYVDSTKAIAPYWFWAASIGPSNREDWTFGAAIQRIQTSLGRLKHAL